MKRLKQLRSMPRLPRYWPIVAVFVAMTMMQASVTAFSIQLLSTVRAYVGGETEYPMGRASRMHHHGRICRQ